MVAEMLEKKPQTISSLSSVTTSAEKILLDLSAHNAKEIRPVLPMRAHSFTRAIPGLWTCINPGCTGGTRPDGWPFGPVLFDQKDSCPHCQSLVFEIQDRKSTRLNSSH